MNETRLKEIEDAVEKAMHSALDEYAPKTEMEELIEAVRSTTRERDALLQVVEFANTQGTPTMQRDGGAGSIVETAWKSVPILNGIRFCIVTDDEAQRAVSVVHAPTTIEATSARLDRAHAEELAQYIVDTHNRALARRVVARGMKEKA